MATATLPGVELDNEWQDVIVTMTAANNAEALFQNRGNVPIDIVSGGASEPAPTVFPLMLKPGEVVKLTAANVWARQVGGSAGQGRLSATTTGV